MTHAVAALARGHRLFAGGDPGHDVGDTLARLHGHADRIRRATHTGGGPAQATTRSAIATGRLRRLAEIDGSLAAILGTARADRFEARTATGLNLHAAIADAVPAGDTPLGRREATVRMAARLRTQHGHIMRARSRARMLALRLRRLRYNHRHAELGSGRAAVRTAIRKALDIKGIHDPVARARWERGMDLVARRESNYDAYAENNWDSNAARGTPSKGAWQFIAPTFAAYHEPGTSTRIHDLVAQACAFINYAQRRYGVAVDASDLADRIQQADPRLGPRGY
ncbi:transglycosylase [Mycobacterium sp. 1081908.1]|uniref:transglycosylase n=1 Tax=Mycobacterium sp. 1081908.1 TaxID=1834066 RepID=UPI0007FE7AED|nr:transglycosylase [Mycobacterium sp. 1081908.1]OBK50809.1 transglycosylase [Mycobacterium sp. 1081908.1]